MSATDYLTDKTATAHTRLKPTVHSMLWQHYTFTFVTITTY